jgi:hypothetical protein
MRDTKEIQEMAGLVRELFETRWGQFQVEDCIAVAEELGVGGHSLKTTHHTDTYHSQQQPGKGYWATAPGAGDISEGMVWVSTEKK